MKDELGGKIMKELVILRAKTYSHNSDETKYQVFTKNPFILNFLQRFERIKRLKFL